MIPQELSYRMIDLPEIDPPSIAIITGQSLRHDRFAYRIQEAFGDQVVAWFQVENREPTTRTIYDRFHKAFCGLKINLYRRFIEKGLASLSEILYPETLLSMMAFYRRTRKIAFEEKRLFDPEIERIKEQAVVEPICISDATSSDFVARVSKVNPCFLLSLGGPLYTKMLLQSIRGVAINQHAGWAPDYKGAKTVEWALYHRNVNRIGSTVHITTSGADAGPILRRSHPCLMPDDSPETCFLRVVALGTELMIEVVKDAMRNKCLLAYEQPAGTGMTFLASQMDRKLTNCIRRDFSRGWLEEELHRMVTN